ncbi:MAG: ferritin family protein [Nitrospinae bacterium]|nr:ferritin family protein [Nitrospinota bacterium]
METTLHRLTFTELLDTATLSEAMAADYYDRLAALADQAGNGEVALFFRDQANRERGHCNRLCKYRDDHGLGDYRTLGAHQRWLSPEIDEPREWDLSREADLNTVLRVVEQAEERAERFYREAAEQADDPVLAQLFLSLANEEARHGRLARTERGRRERQGDLPLPDYDDLGVGQG